MTASGRITLNLQALIPPLAPTGKYRLEQLYLMQPIAAALEPSRVAGGSPLRREGPGPTGIQVGGGNAGLWDNVGGDWLDAGLVRQGPTPWFSVLTNAVSGRAAEADYAVDCTAIVRTAHTMNRWLAMLLRMQPGGSQRVMAAKFSAKGPSISVTYADATTAVLACRLTATATTDSIPNTTAPAMSLPVFAEFERPVKPVLSAVLNFRITQHWSGSGQTLQGFLLDPPMNTSQVRLGIADGQALDAGLKTHAGVVHVHRYLDGSNLSDFVYSAPISGVGYNFSAEAAYDPAIYETGPKDLSKFPHVGLGKWVGAPIDPALHNSNGNWNSGLWTLVRSDYAPEGFKPLAPGLGAIRMLMRAGHDRTNGAPISDGAYVTYGGTNGAAARLFFPESRFGLQKRVFVRQYVRIGTMDGGPYIARIAKRYEVYNSPPPSTATWTNLAGKCFAAPSHDTTFGGFSGTAGGYYGTNFRLSWHETDEVQGGPDEGGWGVGVHIADYQDAQPAGYRLDTQAIQRRASLGQIGGLGGMLYAHRWYCIESEVDLNSVQDTYPGFNPDGAYRIWIDGRLCFQMQDVVFRQNPPYSGWRSVIRPSTFGVNQFAQARIYGANAAKGYAGVTVRHSGVVNGASYTAFISRVSAGTARAVLVKRNSLRLGEQLAITAKAIPWIDGDTLRLEATGSNPTVLTVKQNGTTILSYTDTNDSAYRSNTKIGAFGASNDSSTNGWLLDDWTGGTINGAAESDGFSYTDGLVTSVSNGSWLNMDGVGTGWISSGKLWFPRSGGSLLFNRSLAARPIRDIGHRDVLFNWFHGGLTQNNVDRVIFMTGLVVSDSYIGPMKLS